MFHKETITNDLYFHTEKQIKLTESAVLLLCRQNIGTLHLQLTFSKAFDDALVLVIEQDLLNTM